MVEKKMSKRLSKRKFLKTLMMTYADVIYAYIMNCVKDKAISDKIFKLSWSSIYSNLKYHQSDEAVYVWLFSIVTHTMTSESIKLGHLISEKENELLENLIHLDEEEQNMLLMFFFEKLSFEEIASRTHLSSDCIEPMINSYINKMDKQSSRIEEMLYPTSSKHEKFQNNQSKNRLKNLFQSSESGDRLVRKIQKRITFRKLINVVALSFISLLFVIFVASNFIDIKTSVPIIGKINQTFNENRQPQEYKIHMLQPEIIGDDISIKFQIEDITNDQIQVNVSIPSLTTDIITLDEYNQEGWFEFYYTLPSKALRSEGFDIEFLFYNNHLKFSDKTVRVDMKELLSFDYKIYAVNEEMTFDNAKLIIRNLHIREDTMVLKYEIVGNKDTAFNSFHIYLQDDLGEVYQMDSSSHNSNSSWSTMYFNSKRFNPKANKVDICVASTYYGSVSEIRADDENQLKFDYMNEQYTLESNDKVSGNLSLMLKTDKMKLPRDFPWVFVRNGDEQYQAYLNNYEKKYVQLRQSDVIEVFGSLENILDVEDMTPLVEFVYDNYKAVVSEKEILNNLETLLDHDVMIMRETFEEKTNMVNLMLRGDVAIDQLEFVYINKFFQVDLESSFEIKF